MPGLVPGHPRLSSSRQPKTWMAGINPAMTVEMALATSEVI
jgi:hypothetical protein